MGNYFKGFMVSFIVHALVLLAFIGAGAGIGKSMKSDNIIDISMVSIEKPEEPEDEPPAPVAPPPPPPPPPPQVVEQPKPKPKPVAEPVVIPKDDEIRYAEATEESVAPAEPEVPAYTASEYDPDAERIAAEVEQNLRMGYVKNNFSYIQKRIKRYLVYPSQAKRTGIKGRVTLLFTINMDGSIKDIQVETSSGHEILDEAAKTALLTAAPFPPPPVSAQIVIPIDFKLM